jgi:hypothetical protein
MSKAANAEYRVLHFPELSSNSPVTVKIENSGEQMRVA